MHPSANPTVILLTFRNRSITYGSVSNPVMSCPWISTSYSMTSPRNTARLITPLNNSPVFLIRVISGRMIGLLLHLWQSRFDIFQCNHFTKSSYRQVAFVLLLDYSRNKICPPDKVRDKPAVRKTGTFLPVYLFVRSPLVHDHDPVGQGHGFDLCHG